MSEEKITESKIKRILFLKEKLEEKTELHEIAIKNLDKSYHKRLELEGRLEAIRKHAEDRLSICKDVGGERKEYVDAKNALELNAISSKENLLRLAIWEKDAKKLAVLLKPKEGEKQ